MPRNGSTLIAVLAAALYLGSLTPAHAQRATGPAAGPATSAPVGAADATPPESITIERVQAKVDALKAADDLDDAVRDAALDLYQTALARLEARKASDAQRALYLQAIDSASKTATQIRAQAKAMAATSSAQTDAALPPPDAPMADLEQQLTALEANAVAQRKLSDELAEALRTIGQRSAGARQDIVAEKQKLDEIERLRSASPVPDESPVVTEARRLTLAARRLARIAQISTLEQELNSLPARRDLLTAQQELATAEAAQTETRITRLQRRINEALQREARRQQAEAEKTRKELTGRHPLLQAYAAQTEALTKTQFDLTDRIGDATKARVAIRASESHFTDRELTATQILEIGAVGEEFGAILRELRGELPNAVKMRHDISDREKDIVAARLRRLRLQDQLRQTDDPAAEADRLLAAAREDADSDEPTVTAQVRQTLEDLVVRRRNVLTPLIGAYQTYLQVLEGVNDTARPLAARIEKISASLDKQLLWLPSAPPLGPTWFGQLVEGIRWMSSGWPAAGEALAERLAQTPVLSMGVVGLFAALWFTRRRLRRRLKAIADCVGNVTTDSFAHTPNALVITVLITLPWPMLIGYFGWLLMSASDGTRFVASLGNGLVSAALVIAILRVFQVMTRDDGLFDVHFNWSDHARRRLGRNLGWLIAVEAVAALVVSMCQASGEQDFRNGPGRLAFMIGSFAMATFMFRVMHPRKGTFAHLLGREGWLWRSRMIWFSVVSAGPALLGLLAAFGYYNTAVELQSRLFTTANVGLLAVVIYSLSTRWVVVAHRRLALQRARERREKLLAEKAAARESGDATGEAVPQTLEVPEVDLSSVSEQTRSLLRMVVGLALFLVLWAVWGEIFPALGVLDDVTVWTHSVTTDDGEVIAPVTLGGVALAGVLLALTIVAASNVPGVLEITALQRLPIDAGTRYAISAVCRYVIVAVGLISAFSQLGVDWSKMQWIVAALGVGLGFGLQEIVANFISGLIILFERPVRVGDTVTVADLSGTISRIQIRATTITDWDNREILVPNKAFITDRVINWTLSDSVTRLILKVGIAYGSDTTLAQSVILNAVKSVPTVRQTPGPTVFFVGFGDSSLNFEVRCFVGQLSERMPTVNELHMAIDAALRKHNIEIPFPQRDLHIRPGDGSVAITSDPRPSATDRDADSPQ